MKIAAGVLAAFGLASIGNLCASTLSCSLNGGGAPVGGCYTGPSFIGGVGLASDLLDWGLELGEALDPHTSDITGNTNPYPGNVFNPYDTATSVPNFWQTQTSNGATVNVSLGPNATDTFLARLDNTVQAWDPNTSTWIAANTVAQQEYAAFLNLLTFGGHFGSPTTPGLPSTSEFGDHLIAATDSNGSPVTSGLTLDFPNTITSVGFRISTAPGSPTDFDAIVTAKNSLGGTIGTYSIQAGGSGGACEALNGSPTPGTCNDAPWIGFIDSNAQISDLTIQAFVHGTSTNLPFAIDTLELNTTGPTVGPSNTPEPGSMWMAGAALLGLAFWARRRLQKA